MCRPRTAASIIPMAPQRCAQAVAQDRPGFIPQRRYGVRPDRLTVPHLDRRVQTVSRCRAWATESRPSRGAVPGSPVPGAALKPTIAMRLKTEIRLGLQLFCDCGLL